MLRDRLGIWILGSAGVERLTGREVAVAVGEALERQRVLVDLAGNPQATAVAEALEADGRARDAADLRALVSALEVRRMAAELNQAKAAAAPILEAQPFEPDAGNGRRRATWPPTGLPSNRRSPI